jgi:enoyl-[acyl-carrier protein] reductase II
MFEGDLEHGELEVGQVSSMIRTIQPAGDVVREIWQEYQDALNNLQRLT